jgi:hypothetical protein
MKKKELLLLLLFGIDEKDTRKQIKETHLKTRTAD